MSHILWLSLHPLATSTEAAANALSMSASEYNKFMAEGWTVDELAEDEQKKQRAMKKATSLMFDVVFEKMYSKKKIKQIKTSFIYLSF